MKTLPLPPQAGTMRQVLACLKAGPLPIPKAQRDEPHISDNALRVTVWRLREKGYDIRTRRDKDCPSYILNTH